MNNNINKRHERKLNPRQNANLFSVLTFWWTLPIFHQGLKKEINESTLFKTLKEHASSILGDKLEKEWIKEQNSKKKPSLYKALYRVFGTQIILYGGIFIFNEMFCKLSQPIILLQLLSEFENDESYERTYRIYMYTSMIVVASLCNVITSHFYSFSLQHLGMKIRVACCSLIYRKTLRLKQQSIEKVSVGHIINLLSNDVNRFDKSVVHIHSLWFVPIEAMIIVYVLYTLIGFISTVGVLVVVLLLPLQAYLGTQAIQLRRQIAERTDIRVQLISEIISGIRIIKIYTWEEYFTQLVTLARKLEAKKIRGALFVKGALVSLTSFSMKLSIFIVVLTNVVLGYSITAKYVFSATSFYNVLKQCTSRHLTQAICQVGEARTSIERIGEFLLGEELEKQEPLVNICNGIRKLSNFQAPFKKDAEMASITLKDVSARWSPNSPKKVLSKINLNVQGPQLITITGPVGGGKSSFLKALLKELIIEEGTMHIQGTISYCCQKPWLFAGSIQQNILFTEKLNNKRYQEVVQACSLSKDFMVLPNGDQTIIGERGVTLSGGQRARINLARTIYCDASIYLLDDPLSAVDASVGKAIFHNCFQKYLKNKCTILITHQTQYLENASDLLWMNNGKVTKFISNDLPDTTQPLHLEQSDHHNDLYDDNDPREASDDNKGSQEIQPSTRFGELTRSSYFAYLRNGGNILSTLFVLFLFILEQTSVSGSNYFIAYWIKQEIYNIAHGIRSDITYLYIYTAIIGFMIFINLFTTFYFFHYCTKISVRLHNTMFTKVLGAPLNFFETHSSGRIINRFSKDTGTVDEIIPSLLLDFFQIGLNVLGVCTILVIVKPWMLLVNTVILTLFYVIRKYYLITSRTSKRLESSTRSIVFAHVNASLQGISTIRAFGAQNVLQKELDDYQDIHSSAWFMFISSSTAFGFWLDLICLIYIAIVSFLVTTQAHAANVGLAITQAISLMGMFQYGMRQWGDLENQMVSVERIQQCGKIEQETTTTDMIITRKWPPFGVIEFRSVSLKYPATNTYALKNVTFCINQKEKIGIIGRTGAGKSSIISTIFHLADFEGDISIDKVSIKNVSLKTLRSQITVIPQESVLFSGTLRKNLDPFNKYSDLEIWEALAEVELKETVASFPLQLEENMVDGEMMFSAGQIQLICLTRAVLRNNKIIILDEATANLDQQTDRIIQKTIKNKFRDCTLLTIAHRLDTVIEADKILVMDYGCVVEFDYTHLLLQNKDSMFYKMVQQSKISIV